MTTKENKREYWKPREVAEHFRVSRGCVLLWIQNKKIAAVRLPSNRYLVPDTEIQRITSDTLEPARKQDEELRKRLEEREARKTAALARLRQMCVRDTHTKPRKDKTR